MPCHTYTIEGRVQGVWFRESTRRQAEELGITGYASNLPDGTVEVLACGEPEALSKLAAWLHEGPRLARVENVSRRDWQGEVPTGFVIS